MKNPYVPYPVQIADIAIENEAKDIKTFKLVFEKEEDRRTFQYLPGQFAELSLFGYGESPIGIASSPTEEGRLLFSVKRTGTVTGELHNSEPGRPMGVRGPLGNTFPWPRMEGKNIVVVGGGFAFTTLRSAITYMLAPANRKRFGDLTVIYGARSSGELMYKETLQQWENTPGLRMIVTVDKRDDAWTGREGFVPEVLQDIAPSAANAIALVCGPPIMIKFTIPVLTDLGFSKEDIVLSLEMRMKCGIGKCGRCNIGRKYVCVDGPVFTCRELDGIPAEF
ncbi:MAG: FAD/NAD(P)-binding protein [Verrucomicrobiota bacterium]|nr:FAD/NAD(P)-binding protein [Verrucomicrobiota bacterium]